MAETTPELSSTSTRIAWLALFGVAFGYLEAAVVVYLRAIYYPEGFTFPLVLAEMEIAFVELGRELATLLMLLGIAGLAARSAWGRFGAFAVAFGVWDLVYYLALEITLGWPESLATWDVLFLLPGIWTGPVWSAGVIAVFLVVCGAWIMKADTDGHRPRPGLVGWGGGAVSLLLLLVSFLWNHTPTYNGEIPEWFPWPIWLGGVIVGLATFGWLFIPLRGTESAGKTGGVMHHGESRE
jgi:hypothetical protein